MTTDPTRMLFHRIEANVDAIARVGQDAIERARVAGVPAYYEDPDLGLVARMPDGTVRPVTVRVRPECLPDSVVERLQAIADAHPPADVEWLGGRADEV